MKREVTHMETHEVSSVGRHEETREGKCGESAERGTSVSGAGS